MKKLKPFKSKVTSQSAEEITQIEKENLFSKYLYAPSTSYKAVPLSTFPTDKPGTQYTHSIMKETSDLCVNVDDCNIMDEGNSEIPQKDSGSKNHSLKSNITGSTSSMGAVKNSLNETLDDFQESEMGNRVKCKIAEKSQKDLSFICMMCQGDFTHLTLDERTVHVNQCIDYHSSAVATSQVVQSTTIVLECPLCFKSLPSNEVRKSHIKKCGKSRGLSVQSVIQAIHLQEKHALERKALGLPLNVKSKPVKPPKKAVVKKFTLEPKSSMQSDLQLAKALSLSLKQNESQSQLTILPTNNEDVSIGVLKAPVEFQNPGRPLPKKKRGITHSSLLLLRTEEERKKIIQDKVDAIIILSHKGEDCTEVIEQEKCTSDEQNTAYLWNLSSTVVDKSLYYVEQLLDWIKPSDVEVGSKLCNLSQVPGHRIFTQLPCDYTFSCSNKKTEEDVTMEANSSPSLATSLRSLIGNSWMSDVDIHTASGIVIPAHKLMLALRCPALKNAFDVPIECGKYILNWENTSFDAALHFLNFIYTGATEWKEEIIDELTQLAKKYEVEDLLDILNDSETLELLISEDPETEKSTDTTMDTEFCGKDDSITVDNWNSKKDCLLPQDNHAVVCSTNQINTPSNCKDLKEKSDMDVQSETENECTFIKMSNFPYSPLATSSVATCDTDIALLDTTNSNLNNIKTHHPDVEDCIMSSDSSNDSCKILQDSTLSAFKASPIKSFESTANKNQVFSEISPEKKATSSNVSLNSPHRTYLDQPLQENAVLSDFSFSRSKSASKDSYNSDCEELVSFKLGDKIVNNSNEDIFIVKEFTDKSNSIHKRDSTSFNETLPLETSYDSSRKLSSFSSVFQKEYEDLNSAICQSQNMSFQNQSINTMVNSATKLCDERPISSPENSNPSPMKLKFNKNYGEQYFDSNVSLSKNNSFHNDSCNSNEIDSFDYNNFEMNNVSSPEILVCDSEDETTEQVLGSGYFRSSQNISQNTSPPTINELRKSFLNAVEKENSPDDRFPSDSNINWADKTKLKSPSKENDDVFSHSFCDLNNSEKDTFITNEKSKSFVNRSPIKSSPELICCDSNSDDKLEVVECYQSSNSDKNTFSQNAADYHINVFQDSKNVQLKTTKTSPYKSSLLSSPESPWTFKTNNPSEDIGLPTKSKSLKSSTASSQLRTNLESKYPERKDKKLNTLDKNKCDSSVNTPKDLVKFKISDSPITPLPDYGKMMTPEIKEALKRIGVKALPRKKAVAVLSHIYDETHPWNDGAPGMDMQNLGCASQSQSKSLSQKKNLSLPKKRKETTKMGAGEAKKRMKKCSSTVQSENEFEDKSTKKTDKSSLHSKKTESSNSHKNIPLCDTSPESLKNSSFGSSHSRDGETHNLSISSGLSDSGLPECKENTELLRNFILSKDELYTKILNYTPVNLMEFQHELKENGIKISVKQLTDYLDEQCITFTYPRKEEYKKKQQVRTQRFRKRMIAKLSQQGSSNLS